MKKLKTLLIGLTAILSSNFVFAQNAEIQIIHNAADPGAALVDIYVDGNLTLDNFAFREATPFLSLPSGTINVGVAPPNSSSASDIIATFPVTLVSGERYIAVANGVLNPSSFASNPNGISTAFNIWVQDGIQNMAMNTGEVDFVIVHGATDAPSVAVAAKGVAQLLNNASYGAISNYISVPASDYLIDISAAGTTYPIVATFGADLTGLSNGSAVILASGFLDPSMNLNGSAFNLIAVLADGTVAILPAKSRIQILHNSPDVTVQTVDVWVDNVLTLDNFQFRNATPYLTLNSGAHTVGFALSNSTMPSDIIVSFPVNLISGQSYFAVASGVTVPSNYAINPDGLPIAFTTLLQNDMHEESWNGNSVDLRVIHGSTDAPTVDVLARNVGTLLNDVPYGAISNYLSVPAANYIIDITPGNDNLNLVKSYQADITSLSGGSATIVASGFFNPSANLNGEAFALIAILSDGTVITLPEVVNTTSQLQVIHNAADPAAASVDIYINGQLKADNFQFRTATSFLSLPGDYLLNVGVAPGNSTSVNDTLVNFSVTLAGNTNYVAIANGVLAPASFASNPDGVSTAFTLFIKANAQTSAMSGTMVDFCVVHGSSDAPTVDVLVDGTATPLVDNAKYGDITSYLSVPPTSYILNITPGNNNSSSVAKYVADLTGLGGGSATVFASGFFDPSMNQNGLPFGLFAALANGTVVPFSVYSGIDETSELNEVSVFPNPTSGLININGVNNCTIEVYNSVGQMVKNTNSSTENLKINLSDFTSGQYIFKIISNNETVIKTISVL